MKYTLSRDLKAHEKSQPQNGGDVKFFLGSRGQCF